MDGFKPDFIFWLKKGNQYTLLFIDPKGTEHTDGYRKIDGYARMFEKKVYDYDNLQVCVKLFFRTKKSENVLASYKKYWFSDLSALNLTDFQNL